MKKLITAILFVILTASGYAGNTGVIKLDVYNVDPNAGKIRIGLYQNAEEFEDPEAKPYKWKALEPTGEKMHVRFENIPHGTYAVAIYQDENNNDKLDKNFIGLPTENYGFSNNFTSKTRKPDFEEIAMTLDSDVLYFKVKLD